MLSVAQGWCKSFNFHPFVYLFVFQSSERKRERESCRDVERQTERGGETGTERHRDTKTEKERTISEGDNLQYPSSQQGHVKYLYYIFDDQFPNIAMSYCFYSSVQDQHATVMIENNKIFMEKCNSTARLIHNGEPVTQKTELHHNDR